MAPLSRFGLLALGLALGPSAAPAAAQLPELPQRSERVVHYRMDVRLEEDGHTIRGHLAVRWRNRGDRPTDELYWHVYNNAWEHPDTVWLREGRRFGFLRGEDERPRVWGSTEVRDVAVRLHGAGDEDEAVPVAWQWVSQPGDDPDRPDRTVARVALPAAVPPGGEVEVELDFVTVLPQAYRRSGWGPSGYVHAVQWFPKLGVWEPGPDGWRWNCPPYHYLTEFYADFGTYEVALTVPERYAGHLVSSGTPRPDDPHPAGPGRVQYLLVAEDVHDFAWTGDPKARVVERVFQPGEWRDPEEEARMARVFGVSEEAVRPRPTRMVLLLQPEHDEYEERYFTALARALYYCGLWFGSYPYETITCVDPSHDARQTGGMEYPRLFTAGVRKGSHPRNPSPEGVTVHEFAHQFWYGLSANDEFRHAWLDEGFTTFTTGRVLEAGWPPALAVHTVLGRQWLGRAPLSLPGFAADDPRAWLTGDGAVFPALPVVGGRSFALRHRVSLLRWASEMPRVSYFPRVTRDAVLSNRSAHAGDWSQPLSTPTFALAEAGMRRVNAYRRPMMTLESFARVMGDDAWARVMRHYHAATRFRHARPGQLLETILAHAGDVRLGDGERAVAVDWRDLWRQAYEGNERMDYGVSEFRQLQDEDGSWTVHLGVRRYDGFVAPVELRLTWEDGTTDEWAWDGRSGLWTATLEGRPRRAVLFQVDPERRWLLDRDWTNQDRRAEPLEERSRNLGLRVWIWAQQVLFFAGGMG